MSFKKFLMLKYSTFLLAIFIFLATLPAFAERFLKENLDAEAINNKGQVCGTANFGSGKHAYRRNLESNIIEDLGVLPGDTSSSCIALNNLGQVIGLSSNQNATSGNSSRQFLFTDSVGMIDLSAAYCGNTTNCSFVPKDINDNGQVIGHESHPDPVNSGSFLHRAVLFNINDGSKKYFGISPSENSEVIAFNDAGQTLVSVGNGGIDTKYYLFTDGKGLKSLGKNIILKDINAKGQVLGTVLSGFNPANSLTPFRFQDAALYTDGKGWKKLRLLKEHSISFGLFLNDSGAIFGGGAPSTDRHISTLGVYWSTPECPEKFISTINTDVFFSNTFKDFSNSGLLVSFFNISNAEIVPSLVTTVGAPECNSFEPKGWRSVAPIIADSCKSENCHSTLINYRKILRKKAINAVRTLRASERADRFLKRVSASKRAAAKVDARKRKLLLKKHKSNLTNL